MTVKDGFTRIALIFANSKAIREIRVAPSGWIF
jgi:hypothetical protein